jgi:hypothetical protein
MEKVTTLVCGRRYRFIIKPLYSYFCGNKSFYATYAYDNLNLGHENYIQVAKHPEKNYYPTYYKLLITDIDFVDDVIKKYFDFTDECLKGDWIIAQEYDVYELPMPEFGLFKRAF